MKKLKVLMLSAEKTWRGGEQQIAYLVSELMSRGTEVVVGVKAGSPFEKHCIEKGITVHALPFRNGSDIFTALSVRSICRAESIDLIHAHSSRSHGIAVLAAFFGNKTPIILSRRVDFVPKNSFMTRWKYNHSAVKKILCVSDKITSIMREFVDQPQKCITVHSGIDFQKFEGHGRTDVLRREYGIPEGHWVIGNTSALEDHKDYFTFINCIKILVTSGIPCKALIFGRGSLDKKLQDYTRTSNMEGNIIFTGFKKNIPELMPSLDFFLMTSKEEGLGTSVLDAFASGVPVVATAAGGIPEMVIHEQTGLLAPIGDAKELSACLNRLMADAALRERIISSAKEKVREFSMKETASRTFQVYLDVLAS